MKNGGEDKVYSNARVTFGISSFSFITNTFIKQHCIALKYPLASRMVNEYIYIDDGWTGADSVDEVIEVHNQWQDISDKAGFLFANGIQLNQCF